MAGKMKDNNPSVKVLMDWRDIPVDKTPTEALKEWGNLGKIPTKGSRKSRR